MTPKRSATPGRAAHQPSPGRRGRRRDSGGGPGTPGQSSTCRSPAGGSGRARRARSARLRLLRLAVRRRRAGRGLLGGGPPLVDARRHGAAAAHPGAARATRAVASIVEVYPGRGVARARDLRDVRHRLPRHPTASRCCCRRSSRATRCARSSCWPPGRQAVAGREGARASRTTPRRRQAHPDAPARRPAPGEWGPEPGSRRVTVPSRMLPPWLAGAGAPGRRRRRRLPGAAAARRPDRAQGDGAHAGPARPDVRRRASTAGRSSSPTA